MPALGKRTPAAKSAAVTNSDAVTSQEHKISDYELSREQRIRENRERMGKLGIFNLSVNLKLNGTKKSSRSYSNYKPKTPPSLNPSAPTRRSSRLQNVTPVSYSEVPLKRSEFVGNGSVVIEAGVKPEVYTEEHEKLLGNTENPWTLFVDGYGKDGRRIYDCVRGKTCHQCRQKTLGYRTCCSQCNMVQGQFCGDCLYMRYGEHVLEALQNPNWVCPVCRGICNCSLCRQAKGWLPTGSLYRKISALGYKSVAHYLIQTHRSEKGVEKNADDSNPVSAKRSLPFSDMNSNSLEENENHLGSLKPLAGTEDDVADVSAKRSLLFNDEQDQPEKVECSNTKKRLASSSKPCSDSIAGRLRSRVKNP